METVRLGSTSLTVSRLAFGTMPFGSQVDAAQARKLIDRCLQAGVRFFDTADVYNQGRAEEMLGEILRGRRDSVVVASKVRGRMSDGEGLSRAWILKEAEASLRRLRTDRIDLYYMHQPDYDTPIEETLGAMNELMGLGKVLHYGVSNYAAWQIAEILWVCERRGWAPPAAAQPMHNLVARGIEAELLPFCRRFGLGLFTYNPLAGGLLTGKHDGASAPAEGTRFHGNDMYLKRYWHERTFEAVRRLGRIATESGRTRIQLALQWCLQQPGVTGVILGATSEAQLKENLAAAEGRLEPETLAACDAVWADLAGPAPKYNR